MKNGVRITAIAITIAPRASTTFWDSRSLVSGGELYRASLAGVDPKDAGAARGYLNHRRVELTTSFLAAAQRNLQSFVEQLHSAFAPLGLTLAMTLPYAALPPP